MKDPELIAFGKFIKALRKESEMSQEDVAFSADIDLEQSIISRIESGDCKDLQFVRVLKLLKLFNLDLLEYALIRMDEVGEVNAN